ncbi:MAG: PH domain-containing protein [bacterium]
MGINNLIHTKNYETIVVHVRRHFITYVPTILFFIILLLVPVGVGFLIGSTFPDLLSGAVSYPLLVMLAGIYYLSVMLFFYTSFVEFYLDIHIVTNDRMVDVNQITLFARKIAEVDLYQIQDISSEIRGFFATIFKYGNVDVQTAGSVPKFSMENVPNPHELRRLLLDLSAEDKKFHRKNG